MIFIFGALATIGSLLIAIVAPNIVPSFRLNDIYIQGILMYYSLPIYDCCTLDLPYIQLK